MSFGEEKPKIYAEVGDVLQFYYYNISRWRHSAIITEVSGGDIWYSSRSSNHVEYNRYNERLIDDGCYKTRVIHMLGNSTGM